MQVNKFTASLLLSFLGIQLCIGQKLSYEQKQQYLVTHNIYWEDKTHTGDVSVPQSHEPVTLEMLNCPVGLYRTYDDFVKGKPENLTPLFSTDKGGSARGYTGSELICKDESGKKVNISCDEFWGWKGENGMIWRNGKYASKTGTFAMPFYVEYVSDYVEYHPSFSNQYAEFRPFEWCSTDLKSPLLWADYFHRQNKTRHDKIVKCQNECEQKAPRGINKWTSYCDNCQTNCPDIRFVYVHPEGSSKEGSYKKGGMQNSTSKER